MTAKEDLEMMHAGAKTDYPELADVEKLKEVNKHVYY
jgi:hypothetical protein